MRLTLAMISVGCVLSLSAMAGTIGDVSKDAHPWSFTGSIGYDWYNASYHGGSTADASAQSAIGDGQTPYGRFGIARDVWANNKANVALEIGVQSENTFRLGIPQTSLDELGGLPVQATIKPLIDLLVTSTWQPKDNIPAFGLVKLGVAYRRLQINERVTFNDLSEAAFEVQAGVGLNISDRANVSINYQGVFNGDTIYTINSTTFTGNVSNIPNQNGLLVTLAYKV